MDNTTRIVALLIACLLALCCTACSVQPTEPSPAQSASPSSDPTATPQPAEESEEPTPTPTPSPAPDAEEILDAMQSVDILEYIPEDTYVRAEGQRWYEPVIENEAVTLGLPDKYDRWLQAAIDKGESVGVETVIGDLESPAWPMLAAIVANYEGDPEGMRHALMAAGGLQCTVEEPEPGKYVAKISASPQDATTLVYSLPESEVTNPFSLLLSYAYLSTVFDESLHGREGIGTPELEELLFPIARPEKYYFIDCWGDPRDGGARLHTGTDINAPEGTDLLACVDGVILDNGTNSGAGNYIVLQGHDGTQYHYYHMVEPSDVLPGTVVSRGDVIGHVGDTGNSTANHLHFTIVSSDGQYINPYTYLLRSQTDTIAGKIS